MDRRDFLKLSAPTVLAVARWKSVEDFRPSGCWMSEEYELNDRTKFSNMIGSPEKLSAMARCLGLTRQTRTGGEGAGLPCYYLYPEEREHAIRAGVVACKSWDEFKEFFNRIETAYGSNAETWEKCP